MKSLQNRVEMWLQWKSRVGWVLGISKSPTSSRRNQKNKLKYKWTSIYFKPSPVKRYSKSLNLSMYTFSSTWRNSTFGFNFGILTQKSELKNILSYLVFLASRRRKNLKNVIHCAHLSEMFSLLCSTQHICLVTILGSLVCTNI